MTIGTSTSPVLTTTPRSTSVLVETGINMVGDSHDSKNYCNRLG